jgi:lysophospholipase L1-like esterase
MVSRRSSPFRKAAYAALVLALLLGLSESTLYLLGHALEQSHLMPLDAVHVRASEIWCLGDSHTQGAGAPVGVGYPERLDALLLRQGSTAGVLNLGMGGSNSSQELAYLRSALAFGSPRVVVFMGGGNDTWSLDQVDRATLLAQYGPSSVVYSYLQRVRTFKFLANYLLPLIARNITPPRFALALAAANPDAMAQLLSTARPAETIAILSAQSVLSERQRQLLGGAYFSAQRFENAREQFASIETSSAVDAPINPRLLTAEARRLAEGGRVGDETLAFYERFRPSPLNVRESSVYWLGRGWAETSRGRYPAARGSFALAALFEKGSPSDMAPEGEGWSYLLEGDEARALSYFRRFDRVHPAARYAPPFWAYMGEAWIAGKRRDLPSFHAALNRAKKAFPPALWAKYPLQGAWICMLQAYRAKLEGRPDRMRTMIVRSRELFPLRTLGGESELEFQLQDIPSQSYLQSVPIIHFLSDKGRDPKWEILRANLEELDSLSRRHGFRLLLMGYPKSTLQSLNAVLKEFALRRGLVFVDLLQEVGDVDKDPALRSSDQIHPNAAGYALIAAHVLKAYRPLFPAR